MSVCYPWHEAVEVLKIIDAVPDGHFCLHDLSDLYKVSKGALDDLLIDMPHVVIKNLKYFDINVVKHAIVDYMAHSGSDMWISLSEVSRNLNVSNVMLRNYLIKNGFTNSEYIRTKSGKTDGKALMIHPELIAHLREQRECLKYQSAN